MSTSERKREHVDLAMSIDAESPVSAGWEDVRLVPRSLPELSLGDVDPTVEFLGHRLAAPLFIASMTGGHEEAASVNEVLAAAAESFGIAIGSGSQRAALRDPTLAPTYAVLRQAAPHAFIMANIGVCQLVAQRDEPALTQADIETVVAMVEADALAVHLNILEELVQPEGDEVTSALLAAIEKVVEWSPVPVVAKETGSGMDRATARALSDVGVGALDVGGAGGTSFARIEGARAAAHGDSRRARLGDTFDGWGIPTAMAILETTTAGLPIVATGGVRNGLDAAKAVALGATAAGIGRPALAAVRRGRGALAEEITTMIHEVRVAMVLTGSSHLADLRRDVVLTGDVLRWQDQRSEKP